MPGFDFGFAFGGGLGIVALIWMLLGAAFWALVIVGLILGVQWLIRAERNSRSPKGSAGGVWPQDPLEVLRQRYARGEIDEEEFQRRTRTLTGG